MHAIEVNDLRKSYGHFDAVKGISFTVPKGEVVAFLGPNGAGKTTTVEILEGYRQRSGGKVSVLGHDPAKAERALRQKVGIVLQECGFPKWFTVQELVELHAGYYPNPRSADEVIALVGLDDKRTSRVKALSGGQKRRLDLALAIVGDPELIFLDEPTTGFDPSARRNAWDLVAGLRSLGKTIFLTTHYMDEAQYLADRVIVINGGRIVAEGTPESLGGRNLAVTTVRFHVKPDLVGSMPTQGLDQLAVNNDAVSFSCSDPTEPLNRLTAWAMQNGETLDGLTVSRPSLEDIYLNLTAEVNE